MALFRRRRTDQPDKSSSRRRTTEKAERPKRIYIYIYQQHRGRVKIELRGPATVQPHHGGATSGGVR